LQQYLRFKERYTVQFTGDDRSMVQKAMVDFVETSKLTVRTIEELSLEFVPQTFKRYFQNFLLKANQQFVEILPKTYIFQSRSIYKKPAKLCDQSRSVTTAEYTESK